MTEAAAPADVGDSAHVWRHLVGQVALSCNFSGPNYLYDLRCPNLGVIVASPATLQMVFSYSLQLCQYNSTVCTLVRLL